MQINTKFGPGDVVTYCRVKCVVVRVTAHVTKGQEIMVSIFYDLMPMRDTNQAADVLTICAQNYDAIVCADVCFIIWDGKSYGCMFDLGIAYELGKQVVILDAPVPLLAQSWEEFVAGYERGAEGDPDGKRFQQKKTTERARC